MVALVPWLLLEPGFFYCEQAPSVALRPKLLYFFLPRSSSGSQPAPEACFQEMNSMGNSQGNCGQDSEGSFLPCAQR